MKAVASLPRIIRFLEPEESEGANCPHCGATGRYILNFVVEGGRTLGAMRGCVQLFPVSPIAREEERLARKAKQYAKKGWNLNRADSEAFAAIGAFYAGTMTEQGALAVVKSAKDRNISRYRSRQR